MSSDEPLVSDDRYGVYQADSRKLAEVLADYFNRDELGSLVDATITSPPYADIKDYGYDEQIGSGDSYDQYLDDLRKVFKEVYKVTADDGSLWININNRQFDGRVVDIKAHIIEALENLEGKQHCEKCGDRARRNGETGELYCTNIEAHGDSDEWRYDPSDDSWICHNEIIWNKQKSNDERDGVRNVFEYVLVFKKSDEFGINEDARIYDPTQLKQWWISDTYNYSPDGATYPNVWDIPAEITGGWGDDDLNHDAVFPAALVERMIEMSTNPGDTVLDPFAGSGTTIAVGDLMDRQTIGFELNPEYIALHKSRRNSIEDDWFGGESTHLSLEERKERYAQATWALRHHGYVKWLFTTLRSQARDVAGVHDVWNALTAAGVAENIKRWDTHDSRAIDAAIAATNSTTPVAALLEKLQIAEEQVQIQLGREGKENPSKRTVQKRIHSSRVESVRELLEVIPESPTSMVSALSESLDEDSLQKVCNSLLEDTDVGNADTSESELAQVLLESMSPAEAFIQLGEEVDADNLTKCIREFEDSTQATLGDWGGKEDTSTANKDSVLSGSLLIAVVKSASLEIETRTARIEPLVELQRQHGDRFGVHAVVLQPKTKDGTPPEGESRTPVSQAFLFESKDIEEECATELEGAVEYLQSETPSSNSKKLRKHGLDAQREWISANKFAKRVEDGELSWPKDEFYLYTKGQSEQYTRRFDFTSQLWETCVSNPVRWIDEQCTRTRPAVISPLQLIVEEAEPDQPRYTISRINSYGDTEIEADENYSTSYF